MLATEPRFSPSRFSPSLIRAVANTAMGRPDVLPFWFGESDQATPAFIREAAIASLQQGETFYSENLGRPYLRQAISAYLTRLHERAIGMERVLVTASGVSALMLVAQLLVQPGDRVVTVTPLWPNAVEIPKVVGGEVTCVSLEVQDGRWSLPLEKLLAALTPGTRMLVLNSPNNPTGWTIQVSEQKTLLEHCRRLGIWIVAPVNRVADIAALQEYNVSCVPEFSQRGGVVALEQGEPYVLQMRVDLATKQSRLSAALRRLPRVEVPQAEGAMYVFLRIAGEEDSVGLAKRLIEEVGLGLAPGRAFGPEGEGWLRWCYAADWKKIELGIERLSRFLAG